MFKCKAEPQPIPVGKAEVLNDGSDVAILGLGRMRHGACELGRVDWKETAISAAVINPRFIKPIDREMLANYATAWRHSSRLKIT